MKTPLKRLLFWAPRILCLLFAGFLSVFATDVFGEGYGFWKTVLALLIHLIPTWILLVMLAIAWRWEWAGGILLIGLGAFYLFEFWGRFRWPTYLVISGPLFLTGILFFLSWFGRRQLRTRA